MSTDGSSRWYAVHAVVAVRIQGASQTDPVPVYENVILVRAGSPSEARTRGHDYARREEGDDDGTFTWGERPARLEVVGIRKVVECDESDTEPGDGTEVTYGLLEVAPADVPALVAGREVIVTYRE